MKADNCRLISQFAVSTESTAIGTVQKKQKTQEANDVRPQEECASTSGSPHSPKRDVLLSKKAGELYPRGESAMKELREKLGNVKQSDLHDKAKGRLAIKRNVGMDAVQDSDVRVEDTLNSKRNREKLLNVMIDETAKLYSQEGPFAEHRIEVVQYSGIENPLTLKVADLSQHTVNITTGEFLSPSKLEANACAMVAGDCDRFSGGFFDPLSRANAMEENFCYMVPMFAVATLSLNEQRTKVRPERGATNDFANIRPVVFYGCDGVFDLHKDTALARAGSRSSRGEFDLFAADPEKFNASEALKLVDSKPPIVVLYVVAPDVSDKPGQPYTREMIRDLLVTNFKNFTMVPERDDGTKTVQHAVPFGGGIYGNAHNVLLTLMYYGAMKTRTNLIVHGAGNRSHQLALKLAQQVDEKICGTEGATLEDAAEMFFQEIDARAQVQLDENGVVKTGTDGKPLKDHVHWRITDPNVRQ